MYRRRGAKNSPQQEARRPQGPPDPPGDSYDDRPKRRRRITFSWCLVWCVSPSILVILLLIIVTIGTLSWHLATITSEQSTALAARVGGVSDQSGLRMNPLVVAEDLKNNVTDTSSAITTTTRSIVVAEDLQEDLNNNDTDASSTITTTNTSTTTTTTNATTTQHLRQTEPERQDGTIPIRTIEANESRDILKESPYPKLWVSKNSSYHQMLTAKVERWVLAMHGTGEPQLHEFDTNSTYFAIWTSGGHLVEASAWSILENGTRAYLDAHTYIPPQISAEKDVLEVSGDFAAYHSWWPEFYGHIVDHHLGMLAFLVAKVSEKTRFLLLDVGPFKEILQVLKPDLFSRVTWVSPKQVIKIVDGRLTVSFHPTSSIGPHPRYGANSYLQSWLQSLNVDQPSDGKHIIYYARVKPQATHGRIMDTQHNEDIIAMLQRAMSQHNRTEKLVVFDGTIEDESGVKRHMTYIEQFTLFRSATTVIGPHGTGMSNVVWMDPKPSSQNRVVEFTIGPDNNGEFGDAFREPFAKTYCYKYWGLPFDYNFLVFLSNSTNNRAFIDTKVFEETVNEIFSQ